MEKWSANIDKNLLKEGGGINRFKQHLAGIRGHVKPCGAPNEVIRHIRAEYLQKFETQVT